MPRLKADPTRILDQLDLDILNIVRTDHRRWNPSDIAGALKESEGTIADRVKRLRDEGRLHDVTVVDLVSAGFPLKYRIDIKINPRELRENKGKAENHPERKISSQKALARYIATSLPHDERFAGSVVVEDVTIALGDRADLSATVWVKSHEAIFSFVTEGVRSISGVDSTSTCHEPGRRCEEDSRPRKTQRTNEFPGCLEFRQSSSACYGS